MDIIKQNNSIKYSVLSTLHLFRGKKTSLPKPSSHPRLAAGQCNIRQYICIGAREEETCRKSAIGTCQKGWPRMAPWWR